MTLIVQNNDGDVANANAYISVSFFKTYHDAVGTEYEEDEIEPAIIKATRYVDARFNFPGKEVGEDQTTAFPRTAFKGLPTNFKNAIAEYALVATKEELQVTPKRDASGMRITEISKKLGPLEKSIKYSDSSYTSFNTYPLIDAMMQPFLRSGGFTLSVVRA